MASIDSTMKVEVTVLFAGERTMTEQEFKSWLLDALREAINERGAVIIHPGSNQSLILKDEDEDKDG